MFVARVRSFGIAAKSYVKPFQKQGVTCVFKQAISNQSAKESNKTFLTAGIAALGIGAGVASALYFLRSDEKGKHLPLIGKNDLITPMSSNKPSVPEFKEPTVEEIIKFAESFCKARESGKIDITWTHIPFLANAVQYNFSTLFPDEYIATQDSQTKQQIDVLKKEMKRLVKLENVTYEWWLGFNEKLAMLATPSKYRNKSNGSMVRHHLRNPLFVFPTTMGSISIEDMNKMFATKVWAVGLVNHPVLADGLLMFPDYFFMHDFIHLEGFYNGIISAEEKNQNSLWSFFSQPTDPNIELALARNKLLQMRDFLKSLHSEDLKKTTALIKLLDFAFFYQSHEEVKFSGLIDAFRGKTPSFFDKKEKIDLAYFTKTKWNDQALLLRSDLLADLLPDPEDLGFISHIEMCNFGVSLLKMLLSPQAAPGAKLEKDIDKMLQTFSSKPQEEDVGSEGLRYNENAFRFGTRLSKDELAKYNNAVQSINNRSILSEKVAPLTEVVSDEYDVKYVNDNIKTINKVISYFNDYREKLISQEESITISKINDFMDFVDRSYLG